jgi:KUP system potassium uptake protein
MTTSNSMPAGAALIYGDGMITPAISVLSALEGVNVATDTLRPFVMPMAVAILVGLFAAQRFGAQSIGRAFGPVMLLWFIVIALLGFNFARRVSISTKPCLSQPAISLWENLNARH